MPLRFYVKSMPRILEVQKESFFAVLEPLKTKNDIVFELLETPKSI